MADLAARVAAHLPGWRIAGATLAAPGAVESALHNLENPRILPFFMAEGWFTRTLLPRRLAQAGASGLRQLPAFGHLPGLADLTARAAMDGARAAGMVPRRTTLLLAAHGSQVSRASANGARAMAAAVAHRAPFAQVLTAFVEEPPFIDHTARRLAPAVCLPFFALRASHVAEDVPQALARAGFTGPLLPAIGEHRGVAALVAAALRQAQSSDAAT